ncbi:MAG TPA: PLP-dependent aminotransferase family protein [Rhizomicrobium sp.]|nr:PLP-dependent aminotransferase family protein [Rhizomicrobium sp.]
MRVSSESPVPIYEQITNALRRAIVAGDLPAGTSIPTSRELAAIMKVGRNTVVRAYSQLVAEGYLASGRRRGTRVEEGLASDSFSTPAKSFPVAPDQRSVLVEPINIGIRAQQILKDCRRAIISNGTSSLSHPDPALFPRHHLSRLLIEEFRGSPAKHHAEALARFQAVISTYLRVKRGVSCEPAQIIPVTGLANALDLTARIMIDPGHCVLMEEPAIPDVGQVFSAAGARLAVMPGDRAWVHASQAQLPPPRLIYVSPTLRFPVGTQMPQDQRTAVLEFAQQRGAVIFEDDTGWELTYGTERVRPIHAGDQFGQVIYFGSMNETLGPYIRASYLVVPRHLVDAFHGTADAQGCGPEPFVLAAVARFVEDGQYAVHVKSIRAKYAQRIAVALRAIRNHLKNATPLEPSSGFHVCVLLSEGCDDVEICRRASEQGISVEPLSSFYQHGKQIRGLVLGLGAMSERNIEGAAKRIGELITGEAAHRSAA